jgi:hypothetical protein
MVNARTAHVSKAKKRFLTSSPPRFNLPGANSVMPFARLLGRPLPTNMDGTHS